MMVTAVGTALADTPITTHSPIGFFTNVASCLLSAELNVDLHNIQIYPTNQYTPAVHRLLQVTANIYDATTNRYNDDYPHLPTVFRPIFNVVKTALETNVSICDFSEVTNAYEADAPLSVPWDISNPAVLANLAPGIYSGASAINVFGVPMIIGAKQGFPNFNEFYMESAFQLTRKLLVTRQSTNMPAPPPSLTSSFWSFYEMFNLNLTNQFGVECWNSYQSNYTRPIDIYVTNYLVMTLTNDENFSYMTWLVAGASLSFPNSTNAVWPGYTNAYPYSILSVGSFQIPLMTNFAAVPVSLYRFNTPGDVEDPGRVGPYLTTNLNLPYETNFAAAGYGPYPQPHWGVTVTNNMQVIMVDDSSGRIVDYVQLSGPHSVRDLTTEILRSYDTVNGGNNTGYNDLWDTNLINGIRNGLAWQFYVSQGNGNPTWSSAFWGGDEHTAFDEMNAFRVFTMGQNAFLLTYPGYVPNQTLIGAAETAYAIQMPYTPRATVVQDIVWQVNDPLVHYMAGDLVNLTTSTFTGSPFNWYNNYTYADNFATQPGSGFQSFLSWPGNLGKLNFRYQPWGGNPSTGVGTNLLAIKDPLVTCSDDWDFPDSQPLSVSWLGRVHRGTPWQTVYLKAPDVLSYPNYFGIYGNNGPNVWVNWTGDVNATDAAAMAPMQDWHLASLLACLFNTNDLLSLFSVNNPDPNAWQALLDGLTALTNNLSDAQLLPLTPPQFGVLVISSNSTQASVIANAVETLLTAQPGQFFTDVGSILAIPQLTVNSPFLNWNDSVQQQRGISDEAYEIIPSQLLPLLRADSIGSVTTANGQVVVQFTGYDGHCYAIEVSSNLVNWISIGTNSPAGCVFSFTNSPTLNANPQFYRSILLN
jgi:hypothetical protein